MPLPTMPLVLRGTSFPFPRPRFPNKQPRNNKSTKHTIVFTSNCILMHLLVFKRFGLAFAFVVGMNFRGCEHFRIRAAVRAVWDVNGSFAILYSVLLEALTADKLTLSLLSGTNTVVLQLGALLCGPLYDRFGPRLMTVFAILLGEPLTLTFVLYIFPVSMSKFKSNQSSRCLYLSWKTSFSNRKYEYQSIK